MTDPLSTWNDGPAKAAIVSFVRQVCADADAGGVPPEERVAVFDNDGTLWGEMPMPIQLDFILRRLAEMAEADPALRDRQPWKAAHERDYGWLSRVMAEHYAGDDTNVKTFGQGSWRRSRTFGGSVRGADRRVPAHGPPSHTRPGISGVRIRTDGGTPRLPAGERVRELHRVRWWTRLHAADRSEIYGIPRESVIGSAVALAYTPDEHGGAITRQLAADYLDDGPEKPVRIWSRVGRRPVLAAGNSNGDIEMLDFTQHQDKPTLRLMVLHDDAEREFDYVSGAERALERADESDWTVVSINNDWSTVFGPTS